MSRVEHLEQQVAALTEPELEKFRAWFAEFEEQRWDAQLEFDAANGKLDRMAEAARRSLAEGNSRLL